MTAALIERLGAADHGGYELDAEVHRFAVAHGVEYKGGHLPLYTDSLDAALALAERVLPGVEISMVHSPGGSFPYADVWVHKLSGQCHAKTPALALCIAILKAKAAQS